MHDPIYKGEYAKEREEMLKQVGRVEKLTHIVRKAYWLGVVTGLFFATIILSTIKIFIIWKRI